MPTGAARPATSGMAHRDVWDGIALEEPRSASRTCIFADRTEVIWGNELEIV